jgi:hypothetical protein
MQNSDLRSSRLEHLGTYLGNQWKNSSWIAKLGILLGGLASVFSC